MLSYDEITALFQKKAAIQNRKLCTPEKNAPKPFGPCSREPKVGMPCNAGTIRFVIDSKGVMIPCMSIPEVAINTFEHSFEECWQYIHDTMAKVKQPVECVGCPYEEKCQLCPVGKYDDLFSGHCNKSLCEFAVKEYQAGLLHIKAT